MRQPDLLRYIMTLGSLISQIAESLTELKEEPKRVIGYSKHYQDTYAKDPEKAILDREVPPYFLDHISNLLIAITATLMNLCKEVNDFRQTNGRQRIKFLEEAVTHARQKTSQQQRNETN